MIVLLKNYDTIIISFVLFLSSFFCTVKVYHISIVLSILLLYFSKIIMLYALVPEKLSAYCVYCIIAVTAFGKL